MDDRYTLAAARYVELNPVRAGLVTRVENYPWSSARAHLLGRDDCLVRVAPLLTRVEDWSSFLGESADAQDSDRFRRHETTGRPLGSDAFIDELERALGRVLRPRPSGPAPNGSRERTS
jgi:REP-associated tyrosine transposase